MNDKIQKVLAAAGYGSRRGIEQLIAAGRITVDGQKAVIGQRLNGQEKVIIDGRAVQLGTARPPCRVIMYYKPEGELTTQSDPQNRPTVYDHLPAPGQGRWIYIGRLDINTSGLLLFTTDGELANALMHPKNSIERTYAVRVYGEVSDRTIRRLQEGLTLEDGPAHFERVEFQGSSGRNGWYNVTLREGRKREVRRLWEAAGLTVSRLIRISYGGIALDPGLKSGEFRELSTAEINLLRKAALLEPLDAQGSAEAHPQSMAKLQVPSGKYSSYKSAGQRPSPWESGFGGQDYEKARRVPRERRAGQRAGSALRHTRGESAFGFGRSSGRTSGGDASRGRTNHQGPRQGSSQPHRSRHRPL
ncbi:MAG: pseudouridine synthase [Succinivibrio sp.]|nr:pseudouridine synthase [Succinivibrio sp.]